MNTQVKIYFGLLVFLTVLIVGLIFADVALGALPSQGVNDATGDFTVTGAEDEVHYYIGELDEGITISTTTINIGGRDIGATGEVRFEICFYATAPLSVDEPRCGFGVSSPTVLHQVQIGDVVSNDESMNNLSIDHPDVITSSTAKFLEINVLTTNIADIRLGGSGSSVRDGRLKHLEPVVSSSTDSNVNDPYFFLNSSDPVFDQFITLTSPTSTVLAGDFDNFSVSITPGSGYEGTTHIFYGLVADPLSFVDLGVGQSHGSSTAFTEIIPKSVNLDFGSYVAFATIESITGETLATSSISSFNIGSVDLVAPTVSVIIPQDSALLDGFPSHFKIRVNSGTGYEGTPEVRYGTSTGVYPFVVSGNGGSVLGGQIADHVIPVGYWRVGTWFVEAAVVGVNGLVLATSTEISFTANFPNLIDTSEGIGGGQWDIPIVIPPDDEFVDCDNGVWTFSGFRCNLKVLIEVTIPGMFKEVLDVQFFLSKLQLLFPFSLFYDIVSSVDLVLDEAAFTTEQSITFVMPASLTAFSTATRTMELISSDTTLKSFGASDSLNDDWFEGQRRFFFGFAILFIIVTIGVL